MKFWLRLLVSVSILGLLFLLLPWQQVLEAWHDVSLSVWMWVLAGFGVVHFLGVIKWRMIVNANTGRSPLRLFDASAFYAAGLFANLCLPSLVGGDVLRATLAGKRTAEPEAVVLGGLADRMIDTAALGVLIAGGGLLAGSVLSGWSTQIAVLAGILAVGAGAMMLPLLLRRPLHRWPTKYRRRIGRVLVSLRRLWRSPGITASAFLLALLMQSSFVLLNAWLGRSLGIDVPLAVWFLAWPLAKAAGLLPVSIGGLGVRDATLAALLVPFGVPATQGLVVSLVWYSVLIAGGLIGGMIWWIQSRSPAGERTSFSLLGSTRGFHE